MLGSIAPSSPSHKIKTKNPHKKVVKIMLHTSAECFRPVLKASYISNLNMTCQKKKKSPNDLYMTGIAFLLNTEVTLEPDNYFTAHTE